MVWKLTFSTYMHIVKYWCNYLDCWTSLREDHNKKLSKKCQHKKQMMTLSKMDFFCINFVFTLLEASKWDSFKKFCCIYIYINIKFEMYYILVYFLWFLGGDKQLTICSILLILYSQCLCTKLFTYVTIFLTQMLIQKYDIEFFLP